MQKCHWSVGLALGIILGAVAGYFIRPFIERDRPWSNFERIREVPPGPKLNEIKDNGSVVVFNVEVKHDRKRPGHRFSESRDGILSLLMLVSPKGDVRLLDLRDSTPGSHIDLLNKGMDASENGAGVAQIVPLSFPQDGNLPKKGEYWECLFMTRFGKDSVWEQLLEPGYGSVK